VAWLFVLWLVECCKEDAGVVDLGWTSASACSPSTYATSAGGYAPRRMLVATMASLWSFRLALYILIDRIFKEREDGRYQDLRAYWGGGWRAHGRFLWFFEAQSLLVVLFSLPMLGARAEPASVDQRLGDRGRARLARLGRGRSGRRSSARALPRRSVVGGTGVPRGSTSSWALVRRTAG
jgi:steroid 5-alpha reductase family enzyme